MATLVSNLLTDEEKKKKTTLTGSTDSSVSLVSGGEAPTGGAPSSYSPRQAPDPSRTEQMQQYIAGNVGQTQEMAHRLGDSITSVGTTGISDAITDAREQFTAGMSADPNFDAALLQRATTTPAGLTADEMSQVGAWRTGTFQSPATLADAGLRGVIDTASDRAAQDLSQLSSEQGRMGVMRSFGEHGGASRGNIALDQMLLQSDQGAQSHLSGLMQSQPDAYNAMVNTAIAGTGGVSEEVAARQELYNTARTQTQTGLDTAYSGAEGVQTNVQNKYDLAAEAYTRESGAIPTALQNLTDLNESQLLDLGMSGDQWNSLRDKINTVRTGFLTQGTGSDEFEHAATPFSPSAMYVAADGTNQYRTYDTVLAAYDKLANPSKYYGSTIDSAEANQLRIAENQLGVTAGQDIWKYPDKVATMNPGKIDYMAPTTLKPEYNVGSYQTVSSAPTIEQTTSPEQLAKLNALAGMLGVQQTQVNTSSPVIGQYDPSVVDFDYARALAEIDQLTGHTQDKVDLRTTQAAQALQNWQDEMIRNNYEISASLDFGPDSSGKIHEISL